MDFLTIRPKVTERTAYIDRCTSEIMDISRHTKSRSSINAKSKTEMGRQMVSGRGMFLADTTLCNDHDSTS